MKIRNLLKILLVCITSIIILTGCGNKYCSVDGCPKEHSRYSDYCFQHKCTNSSCNNKGISDYYYCSECLNHN